MAGKYIDSESLVNVDSVADGLDIKPWHGRFDSSDVRYYLNIDDLTRVCLDQQYYKSGNVSGVSYTNFDGNVVSVSHGRFYNRQYDKTYIDADGRVHTTWRPYGTVGENFAEAVAVALNALYR